MGYQDIALLTKEILETLNSSVLEFVIYLIVFENNIGISLNKSSQENFYN